MNNKKYNIQIQSFSEDNSLYVTMVRYRQYMRVQECFPVELTQSIRDGVRGMEGLSEV